MSEELTLTVKLVISAIIGGVTVFPLFRQGLTKEEESRIAWMFFAVAIAVYCFFQTVLVIVAIIAGIIVFLRLAPVISREGVVAVNAVNRQLHENWKPALESKKDPLGHLVGHVPDDVLEEQRRWMEERGL